MNDRNDLARMLRRLEAAENVGDAHSISSMMADDVIIKVPNVDVQEGKEACAEFLRSMLAWMIESLDRHTKYVSAEVGVIGDDAFDRGTFALDDEPEEEDGAA